MEKLSLLFTVAIALVVNERAATFCPKVPEFPPPGFRRGGEVDGRLELTTGKLALGGFVQGLVR